MTRRRLLVTVAVALLATFVVAATAVWLALPSLARWAVVWQVEAQTGRKPDDAGVRSRPARRPPAHHRPPARRPRARPTARRVRPPRRPLPPRHAAARPPLDRGARARHAPRAHRPDRARRAEHLGSARGRRKPGTTAAAHPRSLRAHRRRDPLRGPHADPAAHLARRGAHHRGRPALHREPGAARPRPPRAPPWPARRSRSRSPSVRLRPDAGPRARHAPATWTRRSPTSTCRPTPRWRWSARSIGAGSTRPPSTRRTASGSTARRGIDNLVVRRRGVDASLVTVPSLTFALTSGRRRRAAARPRRGHRPRHRVRSAARPDQSLRDRARSGWWSTASTPRAARPPRSPSPPTLPGGGVLDVQGTARSDARSASALRARISRVDLAFWAPYSRSARRSSPA